MMTTCSIQGIVAFFSWYCCAMLNKSKASYSLAALMKAARGPAVLQWPKKTWSTNRFRTWYGQWMVVALGLLAVRKRERWRKHLLQKPAINMSTLDDAVWADWAWGGSWVCLDVVCVLKAAWEWSHEASLCQMGNYTYMCVYIYV